MLRGSMEKEYSVKAHSNSQDRIDLAAKCRLRDGFRAKEIPCFSACIRPIAALVTFAYYAHTCRRPCSESAPGIPESCGKAFAVIDRTLHMPETISFARSLINKPGFMSHSRRKDHR